MQLQQLSLEFLETAAIANHIISLSDSCLPACLCIQHGAGLFD